MYVSLIFSVSFSWSRADRIAGQDAECGITLTLKTAQPHAATGKVYCAKHYPKEKATSVATSVELERAKSMFIIHAIPISFLTLSCIDAPKVALVNQQKRGDGMENPTVTVDSMQVQNAKSMSFSILKHILCIHKNHVFLMVIIRCSQSCSC